jgi:FkbM family methyltransferase
MPVAKLQEEMDALPCLRPEKELTDADDAVLVCGASCLEEAAAFYGSRLRRLPPVYVYVEGDMPAAPRGMDCRPAEELPAGAAAHLFCKPAAAPCLTGFSGIVRFLLRAGFPRFSVEAASVASFWGRGHVRFSSPDMLKIRAVASVLADKESRATYLAAVKARMAGNPGYLPIAPYQQYLHPDVGPVAGDCCCEGGIDDGDSTRRLAAVVGERGRVHAFEPHPESHARCAAAFAALPNVIPYNVALWSATGAMPFAVNAANPNAARIREGEGETCRCARIDDYFQDKRLDFLKLDIEGAEAPVLAGGAAVLRRDRPKLSVCVYHNQGRDLVDVPWRILRADAGYTRFFVGHHTGWFGETVLYAA